MSPLARGSAAPKGGPVCCYPLCCRGHGLSALARGSVAPKGRGLGCCYPTTRGGRGLSPLAIRSAAPKARGGPPSQRVYSTQGGGGGFATRPLAGDVGTAP